MVELVIPEERRPILNKIRMLPEASLSALISALNRSSKTLSEAGNLSPEETEEVQELIAELHSVRVYRHHTVLEFVSAIAETLRETESFPANEIPVFKERLNRLLTIPPARRAQKAESLKILEARFIELAQ